MIRKQKQPLESLDIVTCLALAAKLTPSDQAIVAVCNRLMLRVRRGLRTHVALIQNAQRPLQTARRTVEEWHNIDAVTRRHHAISALETIIEGAQ
jgi:hypothetical protein